QTEPPQTAVTQSTGKPSQPQRKSERTRASEAQANASTKSERVGDSSDNHMARPMPVIQGSDYLANEVERRYRQSALIAAVMLVLTLAGLFVVLTLIVIELVNRKTPPLWLWPFVPVLLLPLFWLSDRFVELWQEEQNFRRGQLGESEVARLLRLGLGGDWTLFRNVKLPGSKVDIDMVLLGPPGMFALEVKAYTGNYRYAKQHFYRRSMMTWRRMQHNPGKQARAAGGVLHTYIINTLNEDVWVEPRLVWVGPGALVLEEPEVFVWFIEKLDQETERLRALPRKLSAEQCAALSGLLRGLCSTLR
ncbi:MAG: NERD domain-containing protein, partial [Anaerolineae bacterium]|nr:NERD domain-containing protein [Anaerolineae bacterium]